MVSPFLIQFHAQTSITYQMPVSTTIGKYTAVLFALDNDAVEYRDHQPRWAYESGASFDYVWMPVTTSKSTIMTGGIQNSLHQCTITATLEEGITGTVNFAIVGATGNSIPASLSSTSVPLDANSQAQTTLTSSDLEGDITVKITFEDFEKRINIAQSAGSNTSFVCSPTSLPADGSSTATISFILVQSGTSLPVAGHSITFLIDSILDDNNTVIWQHGQPNYPSEYGSITTSTGVTSSDGIAMGIYTVGTMPGTIIIRADDNNDWMP